MVSFDVAIGLFWIGCGIVILIPAWLIAVRGRADLHVHYDDSVDPTYVSRRAGTTALLMAVATITYGLAQVRFGYQPTAFVGLLVTLLVLATLTKRFAQGWGWHGE
ncbi:hypothetical protein [Natronosalvus halobius]|uniref:hypothetical protein n=1 Tax=Natronosalvus halobius TaxID=2953746 RepID=UPI00209DFE0A|nr:hypothetical protein [Natronosalvus halobius]USZ72996.1 hypothetical protein NGM15_06755 [Natronosalvus halobius]